MEVFTCSRLVILINCNFNNWFFVLGEYNIELLDQNARFNLNKYGSIVKEVIYGSHLILHLFDPKDIEMVFRQEGKYPCRFISHVFRY